MRRAARPHSTPRGAPKRALRPAPLPAPENSPAVPGFALPTPSQWPHFVRESSWLEHSSALERVTQAEPCAKQVALDGLFAHGRDSRDLRNRQLFEVIERDQH